MLDYDCARHPGSTSRGPNHIGSQAKLGEQLEGDSSGSEPAARKAFANRVHEAAGQDAVLLEGMVVHVQALLPNIMVVA